MQSKDAATLLRQDVGAVDKDKKGQRGKVLV